MNKSKTKKRIHWMLFAALFALVLCAVFTPATALAQAADAPAAAAASGAPGSAAVTPTPFYLTTEFFAAIFSLVAGAIAVIQTKGKSRAQKVSEVLVLGIEAASKIPVVADGEKRIKGMIKSYAEEHGVEPILHRMVKDLT